MISALIFFTNADTVVEVPRKPEPGTYSVNRLPDAEYISVAQSLVNMLETYQPYTARRQFEAARKFLYEPALSTFDGDYMEGDNPMLETIETLGRTQQFRIDAARVRISRHGNKFVIVRLPGVRYKMFGEKPLAPEKSVWSVKMTTIPKNLYNEYGVVVIDMWENAMGEGAKTTRTKAKVGKKVSKKAAGK